MNDEKLILGLGISSISCANYFDGLNIKYKIFDSRDGSNIDQSYISAIDKRLLYLSHYNDSLFDQIDEVIVSPGFDKNHKIFSELNSRSLPQLTDIDIFKRDCNIPIISITGTNGKTTIVSMLEHVMNNCNVRTIACGNNGIPVLNIDPNNYEYIILELSSYQLDYMNNHNSFISLLANIDHDHLERHGTLDNYISSKLKIFNSCDNSIVNKSFMESFPGKIDMINMLAYGLLQGKIILNNNIIEDVSYNSSGLYYKNISFFKHRGIHNLENILAVCSISLTLNIDLLQCLNALKSYKYLPHRIELIKEANNINWYNDSKSTNTASTIAALKYLDSNIILILGGAKKEMNYNFLNDLINKKVRLLVLLGENKNYIKRQLSIETKIIEVETIEDAVITCIKHASKNYDILFSPASPSFDMYKNFEERGIAFKQAVDKYVK